MEVFQGSDGAGHAPSLYAYRVLPFLVIHTHTPLLRYCPECKTNAGEVIQAGEKMRLTKKKANMQSKKGNCQRDWGKV